MSEKKKEGPRGFAVLVQQIDDGVLHAELSEAVQEITSKLAEQAGHTGLTAKGALTLTLGFAAKKNGTVDIVADVKTKMPKPVRGGSVFWVTDGGNLSPSNPRQQRLPLREVPTIDDPPLELPAEPRAVRTL